MKHIIYFLFAVMGLFVPAAIAQAVNDDAPQPSVIAAWSINYTLGTATRQIKFFAYSDHTGKFITGPRATTSTNNAANAVWDDPAPFFAFSGEVRLPLGNVGQETGTLAFTAFNGNTNLFECQVVFIQNLLTPAQPHYTVRTGTCVTQPIPVTP